MNTKMNPEVKAKLVAALRSGQYKQAKGQLRLNDCFCIWGVICDLSNIAPWKMDSANDPAYLGMVCVAPAPVRDWAGINMYEARVTINGELATLDHHNDMDRTFLELADAIEEQL